MNYLLLAFALISFGVFATTYGHLTEDYWLLAWLGGVAVGFATSHCMINCHQRYLAYRSMKRIKSLADGVKKRRPDTANIGAASMPWNWIDSRVPP